MDRRVAVINTTREYINHLVISHMDGRLVVEVPPPYNEEKNFFLVLTEDELQLRNEECRRSMFGWTLLGKYWRAAWKYMGANEIYHVWKLKDGERT